MTALLDCQGLSYAYSGFALSGIDLSLDPGSILGLIGPSGAGKTTFMKLVMGQLWPSGGKVRVCDLEHSTGLKEIRNRIGYVPEEPPFQPRQRAGDVGGFVGQYYDSWDPARFGSLLDQFQIQPRQQVQDLSRGRKSLLSLAMALSHGADLLLLDEPAAGLDACGRRLVMKLMAEFTAEQDRSVIISTHQTDGLAPLADRIAFLHRGSLILQAETDELLSSWKWLRYRDGVLARELENNLSCRESGAFGCRGLLASYAENRADLASAEAVGDVHVGPATIDDILISLTEGC